MLAALGQWVQGSSCHECDVHPQLLQQLPCYSSMQHAMWWSCGLKGVQLLDMHGHRWCEDAVGPSHALRPGCMPQLTSLHACPYT